MTYKVDYWDSAARQQKSRDTTPEETAEVDGRKSAPAPVPQSVTRRQARQALLLANMLHLVQPAIDAIVDDTARGLMQIEWDDSQTFERHRSTLLSLAAALGLSSGQLDALFTTAATL